MRQKESYLQKFVVAEPGDDGEHCDGAERQDNLPEYGRILTLVKELQAPLLPVIRFRLHSVFPLDPRQLSLLREFRPP